ncbi:NAD(P)-dependent oxidoreductase [Amycolatopsis sp. SID8362]|uniref:NAD-dependent epimerase/dehydratase family protein n=1 Tax=Amycolatopsis sp. SID8362 TaxID=2690346 RepID=UPI001370E54A|nr:NAD(P)-dependent oxidoreductase [Amycolatopsis sp. SID8362]NBH04730.1 NAD-dependent epimerase/dehydratase family protein [Amycolatopsis sp. SID8362]NED41430.1 NAD(P)-dependent oxidoreductase [Amycolatopsis sp. SID8362]
MTDQRVLITGSAGVVGTLMRPRLKRDGRVLRLLDLAPQTASDASEEVVTASVTDAAAMAAACEGVDALIHLGGHSRENSWEATLDVNINGTQTVLEAARQAGITRVVLASSNHAVGFRRNDEDLPADSSPRPDTYYGVSKAAIEALGSLYHSRFGMDVIVIRIGSCFETPLPLGPRGLTTWLSPDDGARLFEACLSAPSPGYRLIWGVSDNTRRIYSLAEAEALGYKSLDDAEVYADQLASRPAPTGAAAEYVGGPFCTAPLGVFNPL